MVNDLKENFKSLEEFDEVLKTQNVTLLDLRRRYKEQLLIKKAVAREVLIKIAISPAKISEYYKRNV